jgi:hypothetical protein
VELVMVSVLDEALDPELSITVGNFPPTNCYTDRASAVDLLGREGVTLRLDDNGNGGIDPRERRVIARGAYVASAKVKAYCTGYSETALKESWLVWHFTTVWYARWLCLRDGNPLPAGIYELYAEVMEDLKEVRAGQLFLSEIPVQLDPEPSWSNMRIDPFFRTNRLRVQKQTSDTSYARFKRRRDTYDQYDVEPSNL